jgi:pyruvate dehydrogenase E2 component (dihydrolipoamide acetyltransferase)
MLKIKLPELGEGVTEGELIKWLVKPGETVVSDQPIVEIMTDKATVEVPSPHPGVVLALIPQEGDTVKVGSDLIHIEESAGGVSLVTAASITNGSIARVGVSGVLSSKSPATESVQKLSQELLPAAQDHVLATPSTRRLAREMGIDINRISGTGLAGRVTREDVLSVGLSSADGSSSSFSSSGSTLESSNLASKGPLETRIPLRGIRKKIAESMQHSKRVIPHFTLMDEAVVTSLVQARTAIQGLAESHGVKVTYLPFIMKALVLTLKDFPILNASLDDEKQEIVYHNEFHVGFAADTPQGLVVPVIKSVDAKNILELSKEIFDLSKKAREGKLKVEEMRGSTITVTNIGSIGGTYATPIINHPEVAILGLYKIMDKVVVTGESQFKVEKVMNFTITADHRLVDGAVAARFLKTLIERVSEPHRLLVELK